MRRYYGKKSRLRGILHEQDGIAAVEFALIAPAFLFMMMGIMEFSMVMYTTAVLEGAVADSSRLGKTGYTQEGMTREELIIQRIEERTAGLLDTSQIVINTRVYQGYGGFNSIGKPEPFTDFNNNGVPDAGEPYSDVNGNGQWDADMAAAGLGNAGDVVVYEVSYPWEIFTPGVSYLIGDNEGHFNVSSSVVVRNEPYSVTVIGGG